MYSKPMQTIYLITRGPVYEFCKGGVWPVCPDGGQSGWASREEGTWAVGWLALLPIDQTPGPAPVEGTISMLDFYYIGFNPSRISSY